MNQRPLFFKLLSNATCFELESFIYLKFDLKATHFERKLYFFCKIFAEQTKKIRTLAPQGF